MGKERGERKEGGEERSSWDLLPTDVFPLTCLYSANPLAQPGANQHGLICGL